MLGRRVTCHEYYRMALHYYKPRTSFNIIIYLGQHPNRQTWNEMKINFIWTDIVTIGFKYHFINGWEFLWYFKITFIHILVLWGWTITLVKILTIGVYLICWARIFSWVGHHHWKAIVTIRTLMCHHHNLGQTWTDIDTHVGQTWTDNGSIRTCMISWAIVTITYGTGSLS
jgi:hypothetical protein